MKEVINEIANWVMLKHRNNKQVVKDIRFLFVDFTSLYVVNLEFENCEFHECIFSDISYCKFTKCFFAPKNKFSDVPKIQSNAKFDRCNLEEFNFDNLNLEGFKFKDCVLTNATFKQSYLTNFSFGGCDMQLIDFSETNLCLLSFLSCNLEGCVFDEVNSKFINNNTVINCNLSFVKILNAVTTKETISRKMNNTSYLELVA